MLRFEPIPEPLAPPPGGWQRSRFKTHYEQTLRELRRELEHIGARDVVVLIDLPRGAIRQDGWPYANAKFGSPGVIVAFNSDHGALRYECNAYDHYGDNLRALAKTLEALRAVSRYGCTKGEQYRGWRALPEENTSEREAAMFIANVVDYEASAQLAEAIMRADGSYRDLYRQAAKRLHPDAGGDAEDFKKLQRAKAVLDRRHG